MHTRLSAGLAALLVAVAVAGCTSRPEAAPPATASPTPVATPTTDPVVLPAGDPALPFGACGALADATPALPVTTSFLPVVELRATTVQAGEPLRLSAGVGLTYDDSAPAGDGVTPGTGPTFAVLHDGVVVATGDVYRGHPAPPAIQPAYGESSPTEYVGSLDLAVCDAGDGPATPGRPLPAGAYSLVPWAEVGRLDAETDDLSWEELEELAKDPASTDSIAVGSAVAFSIEGTATDVAVPEWSTVGMDAGPFQDPVTCGDAEPAAPLSPWLLTLDVTPTTTTLAAGTPLTVTGELRFAGADRTAAFLGWQVEYVAVQDGVVVGDTQLTYDGMLHGVDLGHGDTVPQERSAVLTECLDGGWTDGPPLPAGVYTIYPRMLLAAVLLPDGTPRDDGDPVPDIMGRPFTVTLTS